MRKVTVEDWMELAERIWATNEANGWDVAIAADWDTNKRKLAEKIALIHSELSEAWRGVIFGDDANYLEELADVAIRILDVLEGLHPLEGLRRWFEADVEPFNLATCDLASRAEQIVTVHLKVSEALEYMRKGTLEQFTDQLIVVFRNVADMAGSEFHLFRAMAEKNEVNRQRGFRHGNKAL